MLGALRMGLFGVRMMKINIYMKSGNKINLRGVKKWEFESKGEHVTKLYIQRHWWAWGEKLIVTTINLSQIEAVTHE